MKFNTKRVTWTGVLEQICLVIFLSGQFALSLNGPQFPPTLIQKHQSLQLLKDQKTESTNDNQQYLNIFNSKRLLENVIPSFLKDSFQSSEDFETFAGTGLFTGVGDLCRNVSSELFLQLLSGKPTSWALQMVDAWGKFPAGLLSGHTAIPGDFHECLQLRGNYTNRISKKTSTFKGRYCSTYLVPGDKLLESLLNPENTSTSKANVYNDDNYIFDANLKDALDPLELVAASFGFGVYLFPFIGTCFPSSCSADDARRILTNYYNLTTKGNLEQYVVDCYTDEKPPLDAGDISVIALLSIILFLCVVGSIYDIVLFRRRPEFTPESDTGPSLVAKLMLAFSVPLNTEKLLSTNAGSDNLGCLHGLRFLSMAWVVLAHTYVMTLMQFTWNLIDLQHTYKDWTLLAVLNGTPSVDTFFTISGALMGYNLLRELDRNKGRFNYPLMVVHRFLRLTPTYVILVGMMATILPYLGSGPQWYGMDMGSAVCEKYWWYNALYISNLINQTNVCYGESWYLANDMQFFLVAPLIIYPLWRWSKIGFGVLGAFSIASIVAPAVIQSQKELPPQNIPFIGPKTYNEDLYITPWARMGPYLVGIFLGYILYSRAKSPSLFRKIPVWVVILGWLLSTVTALLIIFGVQSYFDPANEVQTDTSLGSAFYAGLHRFSWGVVIAWIIFACVSGYGGFVNKLLSWKVFMPLGRLTFCVYISSFHLQQFYHLTQTHPVHFSTYATVNMYFAHMVMACLVGYILTITLESPFIQLEKLVIQPRKALSPKIKVELPTNLNNNNNYNDRTK